MIYKQGKEAKEHWGTLNRSFNQLHVIGQIETIPGSYGSYYQNIYDHISNSAELAVKPVEARMVIRLIELTMQSHQEQRTVEAT